MIAMSTFSYLFGITSNELSTWQRRGHPSLAGVRGRERVFAVEDRDDVLRVVFAKALSAAGKSLEEAFTLAGEWVEFEKDGVLSDFFIFNPLTLAGGLVGSDAVSPGFMATERDRMSGGVGYADARPPGRWLFGVAMTAINLREIISRVDEALAGEGADADKVRRGEAGVDA